MIQFSGEYFKDREMLNRAYTKFALICHFNYNFSPFHKAF